MIEAEKVKFIQDLQCKHSSWLVDFNMSLSIGQCVEKMYNDNIIISNLIRVLYSYTPFSDTVTNADKIDITLASHDELEVFNVSISYGAVNLCTFSGTGTQEQIISDIKSLINSGTAIHNYICESKENVLYLYTYDIGYTFSDSPVIIFSESDLTAINLEVTSEPLIEGDLGVILDIWNCISLSDFCSILGYIRNNLTNCNCN